MRAAGVQVDRLHNGDHVALGRGAAVDVLWPRAPEPLTMNNSDLVLKLTYARRTILFPSDIQAAAQAQLLKSPDRLHCDVMLATHHGSGEATTASFIAAADPLYIVSSNDNTLTQKQRLFERQVGDRPLLRTNACGAVTILIEQNGGLTVTPFVRADAATPQLRHLPLRAARSARRDSIRSRCSRVSMVAAVMRLPIAQVAQTNRNTNT